jgi:ParB-like chromosome segregation protein Spo0J
MATTTRSVAGVQRITLSEIRHHHSVQQEILVEEVDALAQSIALLGQLTAGQRPVRRRERRYVLIAGHRRCKG